MGALKLEDVGYTYDDYKQWEGDWELIDGFPFAMAPAPMRKHQSLESQIIRYLASQLDNCSRCEALAEVDYKISNDTVLRPDVVLVCDETNDSYLTVAPEIIFEIISKSSAKRDEKYKFDIYEAELVKYYVLIYPDELVAKVYKNSSDAKYTKQGDFSKNSYKFENTICGIELDFEKVFKRFRNYT